MELWDVTKLLIEFFINAGFIAVFGGVLIWVLVASVVIALGLLKARFGK